MKGNQVPRIKIEPERTSTDGPGAAMLMRAYGLTLDEWQQMLVDCWLGKDSTGAYNVTSAGLSCPRQNGKNVCLEAVEMYHLLVNGGRILHSSHQVRTYKKAFRRLAGIFTNKQHPEITAAVKKIRYGIGEECIELNNGGIIEFISRSRQAARGYDGISLVVIDEAQEATDEQMEALMAVLSASTTGTRQIIYTGTPPYVGCPGEVFGRFRDACIASAGRGEITQNSWHEWSIPAESVEDIDLADRRLWYECNPGMGYRLTEEFTQEECKTLSPPGFVRERLGVWLKPTEAKTEMAIDAALWDSCRSNEPKPEGKTAYGIKFTPDGTEVVLAGAVVPPDPRQPARITLIAVEPMGRGLAWLADWLNQRYGTAACVVIDGKAGSDVLIDKIQSVWVYKNSVIKPTAQNVITAANMLVNDLNEHTITWYEQQEDLRESAVTATKRPISGAWGFGGPLSAPIEACSLALWGVRTSKRNPGKKMKIG